MKTVRRDDVNIAYEEAGGGRRAMVLIHPWCGDHTFMTPVMERFSASHRVLAVDLRGHGQSDRPEGGYDIPSLADDIARLCDETGITSPVIVGNSLGGMIAMELASRPAPVAAVVCLDSPIVPPAGLLDQFRPLAAALRTPHAEAALVAFAEQVGGFADNPERHAWLLQKVRSNAAAPMASTLEALFDYDSDRRAAACKAPLLYLSAGQWFTDVARLRSLCPQAMIGQTIGSGHFHQLEVPEQVNAMIARFLKIAVPNA